ncbi:MAG TPA: hypothetical protein VGQ17_03920 [Gemmatimonadales bacterium]|jgi:hypothetical protein|nr:hypothetical protein [Gemmatimonadales bacterium]
MNEQLKQRILRRLETLADERGYQILDFVEFLESKYAERGAPTNLFAKISEGIEDTMRAARIPIKAISGTTGLVESAGKVMKGVVAATQSVVDEALQAASSSKGAAPAPPPPPARGVPAPAPKSDDAGGA